MPPRSTKRKTASRESISQQSKKQVTRPKDRASLHAAAGYEPHTLESIHDRIEELFLKVPFVPESGFLVDRESGEEKTSNPRPELTSSSQIDVAPSYDKEEIRQWATMVQQVLDEFDLLAACVSPATYVWQADLSGVAEQNLRILSAEMAVAHSQISTQVKPHLENVLSPVVSMMNSQVVITKNEAGETVRTSSYQPVLDDPDHVHLSYTNLARNAGMLRQTLLATLDRFLQAMQDYMTAQYMASQHDSHRLIY